MQRYPRSARNTIWSSHASLFKGEPWLKTIGWPAPQSLKEISVPSPTVMVCRVLDTVARSFSPTLRLKSEFKTRLRVHEGSKQFAVPILHVPRLVPPSLEQRLEPLLRFRPRQRRRERREAVKEAVGGWQRDVVDEFFRCCDGAPVEAGNPARECIHEAVQFLVRKRPIDVSVSFSGLAVEVVRTEHDFQRAPSADEAGKAPGAAPPGVHARADFHLRQGRVLSRGESHVAGEAGRA